MVIITKRKVSDSVLNLMVKIVVNKNNININDDEEILRNINKDFRLNVTKSDLLRIREPSLPILEEDSKLIYKNNT